MTLRETVFLTPTQEAVLRAASKHPEGIVQSDLRGAARGAVVGYLVASGLAIEDATAQAEAGHRAARITTAGLLWIDAMDEIDSMDGGR